MINYIIIFFTQSDCRGALYTIDNTMTYYASIIEWTQDLEDCDKVLRIVSRNDISSELLEKFKKFGIKAELVAVYPYDEPVKNFM